MVMHFSVSFLLFWVFATGNIGKLDLCKDFEGGAEVCKCKTESETVRVNQEMDDG